MDYEKKYKELVAKIKNAHLYAQTDSTKNVLEGILPELAESEDERILEIIKHCIESRYLHTSTIKGISQKQCFAWLEKQGEQKPSTEVKPKFKVCDWVVTSYGKVNQVVSVDKDGDGYTLDDDTYFSGSWCNMYHLWTIADAKDGDVLHSPSHRLIWIYKDNKHYHTCINMNYVTENIAIDGLIEIPSDVCPATTVQRSILFSKMEGAGYEWNSKKRKLKKISQRMISAWAKESGYSKPTDEDMVEVLRTEYEKGRADAIAEMEKPAWSEDDEKRLQSCINILKAKSLMGKVDTANTMWLKSLKQRIGG